MDYLGQRGYVSTIKCFLDKDVEDIIDYLSVRYKYINAHQDELADSQVTAWRSSIIALQRELALLPECYKKLHIIFEYVLPGRKYSPEKTDYNQETNVRPDVLIVSKESVCILEFKRSIKAIDGAVAQVLKYKKRFANNHVESIGMRKPTIVIITDVNDDIYKRQTHTIVCTENRIKEAVLEALGEVVTKHDDISKWMNSEFRKTIKKDNGKNSAVV